MTGYQICSFFCRCAASGGCSLRIDEFITHAHIHTRVRIRKRARAHILDVSSRRSPPVEKYTQNHMLTVVVRVSFRQLGHDHMPYSCTLEAGQPVALLTIWHIQDDIDAPCCMCHRLERHRCSEERSRETDVHSHDASTALADMSIQIQDERK